MSSSSSSSNDNSVRIHDYSNKSDQATDSVKNVAKGIHESSLTVRGLILTLLRSGAIAEIALAIHEATTAIRDTANEINDTVKDLKERGTIKNTVHAVEETRRAALETLHIVKNATTESTNGNKNFVKGSQ
jgi:methyl-accepting chemotaxis protein